MGTADPALGEGYGVVGDSQEPQTLILWGFLLCFGFFFPLLLCTWAEQNELWAEVKMSAWPDCTGREIPLVHNSMIVGITGT